MAVDEAPKQRGALWGSVPIFDQDIVLEGGYAPVVGVKSLR